MPLTKTPVTGPVSAPDGVLPAGGALVFTPSGMDTEDGTVQAGTPVRVTLEADGDIPAGFELWPNSRGIRGTHYAVTLTWQGGSVALGNVQVGEAASYTLAELLDNPVPDAPGVYPVADIPAEVFAGTTYSIAAADKGKAKESSNSGAVTVTLPNSIDAGFSCLVMQGGTGQITFAAASGATLRQSLSLTKTYARYSEVTLRVRANTTGTAAEWVLSGDMA